MKKIDCSGMACPKPVVLTKKELESMETGQLEVIVDNEAAKENVTKLVKNMGLQYELFEHDNYFQIIINKEITNSCCQVSYDKESKTVILIGSDKLGTGDDKLGSALMKSFIYALVEAEAKPKTLIFLNSGVKLTIEGSDVLDNLKKLQDFGVEILSCGTCLDFYGLKEKLAAGTVTNMYTIVEKINSASNTIKL